MPTNSDITGKWLQGHEDYLEGRITYDELQRRNSGCETTSVHLTEEQRTGLQCDPVAFKRACDDSLSYYAARASSRRLIVLSIWSNVVSFLCAVFLVVWFLSISPIVSSVWFLVGVLDVLGFFSQLRRLQEHDRTGI